MHVQISDGASGVLVIVPDANIATFGKGFVRVQGLASTVNGRPAVLLQQDGTAYGGVVACPQPRMHAASRKLAQTAASAACGGEGQPVCKGAQLEGAPPHP
jgi:hypothetical protein